ncbi:M23 family metallopeptidase [Qipengyuania sp. DGS5-3]|uniref:M23 family metallopeptidase n=1 Tax=Qipengyuania sp. DGS5-3 TaxID=3349632 RepID=UPI0036D21732
MYSTIGKSKAGALCAAFATMLVAAAPAQAEDGSPIEVEESALAPISKVPVVGDPLTGAAHDRQFKQLFASWESLDEGKPTTTSVAIPSRSPLDAMRLTSGYGMRTHPILKRRARHRGVDLAAPTGTPVYATADGVVGRADWFSSYGLYVKIDHGGALETRYAHMSKLAVNAGEHVKKGDVIGYVGSTGRSTGPHLHYEVRVDGQDVNPIQFMNGADGTMAYQKAMGAGIGGGPE